MNLTPTAQLPLTTLALPACLPIFQNTVLYPLAPSSQTAKLKPLSRLKCTNDEVAPAGDVRRAALQRDTYGFPMRTSGAQYSIVPQNV